ncbi:DUF2218 domain-containing protein [Altericroceibacterium xinjiangense]|uniref:DUF2218 domain-containing protein n=1 Tax=Altericroceibacterium xinjiangense TaxID=762261 RepID=UPI000F7E753F|nr:DUF2218 domain-containing protein [Altericroceibacterium xinjiangense]
MTVTALGFAPCEKPARYVQTLTKHWSNKMATTWEERGENGGHAEFPFSDEENCAMDIRADGIAITLTTPDQTRNVHLRGVIERHLDRFAFREAPLSFDWKEQ